MGLVSSGATRLTGILCYGYIFTACCGAGKTGKQAVAADGLDCVIPCFLLFIGSDVFSVGRFDGRNGAFARTAGTPIDSHKARGQKA